MAYYPNNSMPATGPHSARPQNSPARAQRVNQAQYVEERLRNGLSPVAVAGVAALLTQLETMQTLPGVSLSIVTEVAGYRRTLTCLNNAWDGRPNSSIPGRAVHCDVWPKPGHQIRTRGLIVHGAC